MIKDQEQFQKYLDILPPLQRDEVFFISLSARNKYLTQEERDYYKLSKTEMFARTIIPYDENFDYALDKLKSHLEYKKTKTGHKYPEKSLITYININPSSMIDAFEKFIKETNRDLFETFRALQGDKNPNYDRFKRIDRALLNCVQKSRSQKHFIDIDCDVEDVSIVEDFKAELDDYNTVYFTVKTKGGYHILIKPKTLKNTGIRLDKIVKKANTEAVKTGGEVIFNKNQMVPLPGTLQAGQLVTIE